MFFYARRFQRFQLFPRVWGLELVGNETVIFLDVLVVSAAPESTDMYIFLILPFPIPAREYTLLGFAGSEVQKRAQEVV